MNTFTRIVWLVSAISMFIFMIMIAPTASYSFIAALPFGIIGIIGFIFIVILIGRNYLDEKEDEKERVKKELGL